MVQTIAVRVILTYKKEKLLYVMNSYNIQVM